MKTVELIIVFIILACCVCYAGYKTYRALKGSADPCAGCEGCALSEVKRRQKMNKYGSSTKCDKKTPKKFAQTE